MRSPACPATLRNAVQALVVLGFWSCEVCAGEIPNTAVSTSLGVTPILLDSPWLVYRFPEYAVAVDSVPLALAEPQSTSEILASVGQSSYSYDEFLRIYQPSYRGVGAVLRSPRVGGFVLAQPDFGLGSLDASPSGSSSQITMLQAGVGTRWKSLRFGVAVRGGRRSSDVGSADITPTATSLGGRQEEVTIKELALGFGWTTQRLTSDMVVELWDEKDNHTAGTLSPSDTTAVQLSGDSHQGTALAFRTGYLLQPQLRLVAAFDVRLGYMDWSELRFQSNRLSEVTRRTDSKSWGANLSFLFPAPSLDLIAVTGAYQLRDEPQVGLDGSSSEYLAYHLESLSGTISLRTTLWRRLELHSAATIEWRREETTVVRSAPDYNPAAQRRETVGHAFSSGLMYSWRHFDVAGTLSLPPYLSQPATLVDIHVHP